MSTIDLGRRQADGTVASRREFASASPREMLRTALLPFASLRLTVFLFALSIILVLAGTLAQIDHDIWYVIHYYFRCWFAFIKLQIFFPRAWNVPGVFPFPGGWLLGAALGINLLVAHALRFKVTAKGRQRKVGLGLIALGVLLTYWVVQSGLDDTVESELSPAFCNGLWHAMRFLLGTVTLGLSYWLVLVYHKAKQSAASWLWWLGAVAALLLGSLAVWLFTHPEAKLDPSGLRILWQLAKASAAGLVLLAGCHWVFGRRAGIVLLHGGIALMMFNELWVGLQAQESQMRIAEGQSANFSTDIRQVELAIVNKSSPKEDEVTTVSLDKLQKAIKGDGKIESESLPFALRLKKYLPNVSTRFAQPGETTAASHGHGALHTAIEQPVSTGVGEQQGVDFPAVVLELLDKADQSSLGTYFLAPQLLEESLEFEGKPYEIALRFEKIHKPYSVKLIDFRFDRYISTNTAKNFSSKVELIDPEHNVEGRTFTISMNNPLRYRGDTLYQADWDKETERGTVLQVMTNSGWMIPYVSCMLVATGMLAHFGLLFWRFVRRQKPTNYATQKSFSELMASWRSSSVWVPAVLVLVFGGWALSKARAPKSKPSEMQIQAFGQLPVAYQGRVQPFDSLARNTLTVLSGREVVYVHDIDYFLFQPKLPAIRWILDLIAGTSASDQHRILRIENLDVLQALDLKPRDGYRYSREEVAPHTTSIMRQARLADEVAEGKRSLVQQKFLELARNIRLLEILQYSFAPPPLRFDSREHVEEDLANLNSAIATLKLGGPQAVPPEEPEGEWQILLEAERDAILQRVREKEVNQATLALRELIEAYRANDAARFSRELASYKEIVAERSAAVEKLDDTQPATESGRKEAEKLRMHRVEFEAFFNHFNPFKQAMALYLFAFVLAAGAWLVWTATLNRSAHWLLWFTFALHTYAMICRIYISGRPPVTNLYSSAIFIGWAAVLFALVFERIYRFGVGNLLAALVGFPTLFIAYNLAGDGDTFMVLQAVLDTQFWLATHVVCITLGYSTTFLAGMLGVIYVLMAHVTSRLDEIQREQLVRMIYGTICFAIFFSFVGTVLGGLWADDSWGRFWGWDTKENGALMIVIWNALVLHARWGAMVRRRGLAVLAVFGNIVTAWSWFGVNQLGVGLHAYGFTEGRNFLLFLFVASQLLVMALGCLPLQKKRSRNPQPT